MPPPTPSDVADGVRTAWAASAPLTALVPPARVFAGRADVADPTQPYAVVTAAPAGGERSSGPWGTAVWDVTIDVYLTDPVTAGPADRAVRGVLTPAALAVPNTHQTITVARRPAGGHAGTGERLRGDDLVRVTVAARVTCGADHGEGY